jgi:4'-phosphopantetheinyl transferase EntD
LIRRAIILLMLVCYKPSAMRGVYSFVVQRRSIPRRHAAFRLRSTIADNTQSPISLPTICNQWLDIELPQGRCVGVSIPQDLPDSDPDAITRENLETNPNHWIFSVFHKKEIEYGLEAASHSFWIGRTAMKLALGFPANPILKDEYGRPQLPPGICGSISHKLDRGVALVARVENTTSMSIGIDLEVTSRPGKRSVAPRVLTEKERQSLGNIPNLTVEEEVLLRFRCVLKICGKTCSSRLCKLADLLSVSSVYSLKEAIYKATHPLICQYVGFQEAEVIPYANGTATCNWFLESGAHERLGNMTAHWRKTDDGKFFLTSASAQLKEGQEDDCLI